MSNPTATAHRQARPALRRAPGSIVLLHRGGAHIRGTEAVLIRSASVLAASGFHLIVCRRNPCIDEPVRAVYPRAEFVHLRFSELMIGGIRDVSLPIRSYLRELRQLRALVARCSAQLLYCSGGLPCQLGVPVARLAGIPIICHFHHPAPPRAHYLWLSKFVDRRVYPSSFVQRHSPSSPGNPGTVIYNGVDLARYRPARARDPSWRARWGIPADSVVIGQVGALVPHKRADFLISALASLIRSSERNIHLCVVGAGPMETVLRQLVCTAGLASRVIITGYVDDALPYYQHVFDINVLVSDTEGLGISIIEGAACGLPAVVSNCTGLPETIVDQETGFLFDVNDAVRLREHIIRLADSATLRQSMGAAGRALTEKRFCATAYDERFMSFVHELLQS